MIPHSRGNRRPYAEIFALAACGLIGLAGCKKQDQGNGTPPPAQVVQVSDMNLLTIDQNDLPKFPLVSAERVELAPELNVTGTVSPDVSREVPVITLANGRVVDVKVRLGDDIKKGQLLFRVQSPDVTNAFDAYLKAVNDEQLANKADIRAQDLFKHGAISQAMVEQADDSERDAKAELDAADQQLQILGVDKNHPSSVVDVYAPIAGVIIAQNITNAAAAGVSLSGSATAFTIADLTEVWVLCDAYENDIPKLQLRQEAVIRLNAYPDRPVRGRVSDIGPVLDPQMRTAKVRIQVANPGFLKLGMFATATFTSRKTEAHAAVPANAVLHLHDRDWVFVPAGANQFRRTQVRTGQMLSGNRQMIFSGIDPGQQVVSNALMLETAGNQQ
jgi:cobalt-zinc-cadmium efflux system membrane fusion protein